MERIAYQQFSFSEPLSQFISIELDKMQWSFSDSKKIADAIKKLSDFYQNNPGSPTPWEQPWAAVAYLTYFFALGSMRSQAVVQEAKKLGFFSGLRNFVELGSGPGTLSYWIAPLFSQGRFVEVSLKAQNFHKRLNQFQSLSTKISFSEKIERGATFDLGLFSYVLNETGYEILDQLNLDSILIIEPSTNQAGRSLMALRKGLIQKGFYCWAPCTHSLGCPLLEKSKSDWCHHRIRIEMPQWFKKIEDYLPMKNETVTFSYLLMSRKKPIEHFQKVRVIGDILEEKGKTRQAVCYDNERRFLSWLHKDHVARGLVRGEVFALDQYEIKTISQELRVLK